MKRRRVERAVLIWPKESKKLGQEDEEIQPGSKIKKIISSLPNFAAGLVIITTLSAILSNVIINLYDRGYSRYFGISDMIVNDSFVFKYFLFICIFIVILASILIKFVNEVFKNQKLIKIIFGGIFFGFLLSNIFFMYVSNAFNYASFFTFTILETFFVYFIVLFKNLPDYVPKDYRNRKKKVFALSLIYIVLINLLLFFYSFINRNIINMFSSIGSHFAQVEANYKIVSYEYENASYLLLENTDHQYILMEVEEIACEDEKICYKGMRGKYQYIEDLTNLQIQETYCKIIF